MPTGERHCETSLKAATDDLFDSQKEDRASGDL